MQSATSSTPTCWGCDEASALLLHRFRFVVFLGRSYGDDVQPLAPMMRLLAAVVVGFNAALVMVVVGLAFFVVLMRPT